MQRENLAYPDIDALSRLVEALSGYFAGLPYVSRVLLFGSFARGDWDRWSDIDMLVVTDNGRFHQQLFNDLQQHKPILHHHIFTPQAEPAGGNVLGIVFEDESVFHNLDLNFMSFADYSLPNVLDRFGQTKEVFAGEDRSMNPTDAIIYPTNMAVELDPDERRIGLGIHWTKKAVKSVLRGENHLEILLKTNVRLKEIMQNYPKDIPFLGGNICFLARTYIKISDQVLQDVVLS